MLWDLEEQRYYVCIGIIELYFLKFIGFSMDFKEYNYFLNKLGEGIKDSGFKIFLV